MEYESIHFGRRSNIITIVSLVNTAKNRVRLFFNMIALMMCPYLFISYFLDDKTVMAIMMLQYMPILGTISPLNDHYAMS